ncbi:MAG TPA: hypothetical protein VIU33_00475 [Nitrospiria bacterium]
MKGTRFSLIILSFALILTFLPAPKKAHPAEGKLPEMKTSDVVYPDMEVVLRTTVLDRTGHRVSTRQRIHRSGYKVRYENLDSSSRDIWIVDYESKREVRIHERDKIFFSRGVGHSSTLRAAREGLIPLFKFSEVRVRRVLITEMDVSGHPCEVVLVIRELKDKEDVGAEYTLQWEALDLDRQPLRVAFHTVNDSLVVLDYEDMRMEAVSPDLLSPPEDYLNLSPF